MIWGEERGGRYIDVNGDEKWRRWTVRARDCGDEPVLLGGCIGDL